MMFLLVIAMGSGLLHRLWAVSLSSVVHRAKRETRKWPRACIAKSEEKERLLAVYLLHCSMDDFSKVNETRIKVVSSYLSRHVEVRCPHGK